MTYKELMIACRQHSGAGQMQDLLREELERLHITTEDVQIRFMPADIYDYLIDKALQLELLLLKASVDTIMNKKFTDKDRERVLATIKYLKTESNLCLFEYIRGH